uniref:Major capsid protein N-terminal domain-containing protein n=1 Tax=viral metagenome TaxID=1070528 RepID=A0A6C0E935_9ZZZZ
MGGGLLQLVAYGAQDVYLTGNPQITYMKVVYRRHTNFAIETIEHSIDSARPGGTHNIEILRNGDCAGPCTLRVGLPDFLGSRCTYSADPVANTKVAYVRRFGHAMVKSVKVQIGGSDIDKHYGVWLDIWYELTHDVNQERGYRELIGDTAELTTLTGPTSSDANEVVLPATQIYVPLQFWFNRNTGLSLPLIALQYHQVRVYVEFEDINKLVMWSGANAPNLSGFTFSDAALQVDYFYLDSEERRRFAQVGHEYLIEQVQAPSGENGDALNSSSSSSFTQRFELNFNHPTKELVWATKVGAFNGEGNRTSGSGSRGRFLCYTEQDDVNSWNDALNYAARNLANGMIVVSHTEPTNTGATWEQVYFDSDIAQDTTGLASMVDANGTVWNFTVTNNGSATINSGDRDNRTQNIWINTTPLSKNGTDLSLGLVEINVDLTVEVVGSNIATSFKLSGVDRDVSTGSTVYYLDYDDITVVSHNLNLNDVSVPVEDFTDSRAHKIASSSAKSKWDVVVIQPNNYGLRLDGRGNPVAEGNISLNGHDRFATQKDKYFNFLQARKHTHTPADGINVYCFGLLPEQHQPSGSANLSRIDKTILNLKFMDGKRTNRTIKLDFTTDTKFYTFAFSYNVLRVMSGMAGLAYSS